MEKINVWISSPPSASAEKWIFTGTNLSEMRVAKAASLALMLQERAEPSLLFLKARIAMILQILLTEKTNKQTSKSFKTELYWKDLTFLPLFVW